MSTRISLKIKNNFWGQAAWNPLPLFSETEAFFPRPDSPKSKPRLFFQDQILRYWYFFCRDQIFRNKNWDFLSETKFSETDTKTLQKLAKVLGLRPKPRLLNILDSFWSYLLQIFSSFAFPRIRIKQKNDHNSNKRFALFREDINRKKRFLSGIARIT